ncbi:MAG: hypothetical protein DSY84_05480 [Candidatus Neomarinimicrobiota bacterium]|nr:MAG: hypothetical protein DSY84_05480 [Candidatus Neomarinimicrobiota bacterium]
MSTPESGRSSGPTCCVAPPPGGVKIGSRLFTSEGPSLISTLTHRGDRVFLDLKYHDIPTVAAEAVRAAARLGTWMLTVHSSCPRTRSRPPRPS